jgi:hypothetical protein
VALSAAAATGADVDEAKEREVARGEETAQKLKTMVETSRREWEEGLRAAAQTGTCDICGTHHKDMSNMVRKLQTTSKLWYDEKQTNERQTNERREERSRRPSIEGLSHEASEERRYGCVPI